MLYVAFCLCTWGAQPCFCHDSSLLEWFAKTIEVTNNPDDCIGRMFAINGAMAAVPNISEATVIKFLQSQGLRPEGTSGGKMAQKRVFIGGRPKTAKEQSTKVSAPQAKDSDDDAEDGTEDKGSSSDEVQAYEKKKDALHAFRMNGFKYRYTQSNDCDVMCCLSRPVRDLGKAVLLSRKCGEMPPQLGCGLLKLLHRTAMTVPIAQWA